MPNPQKEKGKRWERDLRSFFRARGRSVERILSGRADDIGDLSGIPGWTIEAKDQKTLAFSLWIKEAQEEAANAGTPWYCVIAKRARRPIGDAYVVLDLETFASVLDEMDDLREARNLLTRRS